MNINGIVLINKERGVSSNSVVNKVKHLLNADKAGHLGTLDVLGEGLLPVTLGKGTKLFDYFLNKDKTYNTIFKFGYTTTTLDLEGEITQKNEVIVNQKDIEQILPQFIGRQKQIPPIYSAKKINGKKAYQLAREGNLKINLKPKIIEIYEIKLLKQIDINTFEFEIHCSSGTYIRSVCRDMGNKLSTYGVMLSINRTKCGDFNLKDAYKIEDIKNNHFKIISLDSVFDYTKIQLSENQSLKLLNGMNIEINLNDGLYKVYQNNTFLGIGEIRQNHLKLKLRLF